MKRKALSEQGRQDILVEAIEPVLDDYRNDRYSRFFTCPHATQINTRNYVRDLCDQRVPTNFSGKINEEIISVKPQRLHLLLNNGCPYNNPPSCWRRLTIRPVLVTRWRSCIMKHSKSIHHREIECSLFSCLFITW